MARLDYYTVEAAIKTALTVSGLPNANRIFIEEEVLFDMNTCPAIFIYIENRTAPAGEQRLAAGTRTDFLLYFSIWCCEFNMESMADASQARDDLLGKAEVALMNDRTLGGNVDAIWLEGGRFMTALTDPGYISAAEIVLVAKANATT